mgnify:FL=1
MSHVDVAPDEARALVGKLNALVEEFRSQTRTISTQVGEIAGANYVSETTHALQNRWEGETLPQFQKIFNRVEEANRGTNTGVDTSMDIQGSAGAAIGRV